jgi:hypothetical protein
VVLRDVEERFEMMGDGAGGYRLSRVGDCLVVTDARTAEVEITIPAAPAGSALEDAAVLSLLAALAALEGQHLHE